MQITGTHFNYYGVCRRKLWLFANGITMEHTSDLVAEGRLIHEDSYSERPLRYQEFQIDGVKVDFYDPKRKVIHEVKKSDKMEYAHVLQLKYYIYVFGKNGIDGVTGLLEYPSMRKTEEVILSEQDKIRIEAIECDIERICNSDKCPVGTMDGKCRKCSYYDFCFAGEAVGDL